MESTIGHIGDVTAWLSISVIHTLAAIVDQCQAGYDVCWVKHAVRLSWHGRYLALDTARLEGSFRIGTIFTRNVIHAD